MWGEAFHDIQSLGHEAGPSRVTRPTVVPLPVPWELMDRGSVSVSPGELAAAKMRERAGIEQNGLAKGTSEKQWAESPILDRAVSKIAGGVCGGG